MLNATVRGMACRLPAVEADKLPSDEGSVHTSFCLAEGDLAFEVAGQVRSVTTAGTPGHVVLGMEFVFEASEGEEERRLRAAFQAVGAEGGRTQAL
jgi:hypothetical protein